MKELRVIENDLVPVYETSTGKKVVYGTELHTVLDVKTPYRTWIERRFDECEAIENQDYSSEQICTLSGGTPKKEHLIKLDTAKEMAMLERNEKGKQVRRYFIQVEKKYQEVRRKPLTAVEQLQLQTQAILEVHEEVKAVNEDLQQFKMDMPILGIEIDRITEAVHKRGVAALGGKESNAYNDRSLRGKVYSDIYRELKRQFGVTTYKAIKRNQCDMAVSIVDEYELPIILAEQVRDYNAQLNMEVA